MDSRPLKKGAVAFLWIFFGVFLIAPFVNIITTSVFQKAPYGGVEHVLTFSNYQRAFNSSYFLILIESLKLSFVTAFSCAILGTPLAWTLATARKSVKTILLCGLLIPFFTNCVIRAYGIKLFLGAGGPLTLLFGSEFNLTDSQFAIWFGMLVTYLPLYVLPVSLSFERFDLSLIDAARDLGSNALRTAALVVFPGVRHGIFAGLLFVFVPTLCEFLIPDFLGGARTLLFGGLVSDQFLKARDWPFGAALANVLLLFIFLSQWSKNRIMQKSPVS